jgi:hypothetical protein
MIPTDEKLIDDFKKIIRIHHLKMCLFHKMEQLKHEFKDKIEKYREIEGVIDPGSKQENTKECLNQVKFEIEKVNQEWMISRPGSPYDIKIIPPGILKHITSSNVEPGIIQAVNNFKAENEKIFDFSFERQREDYITCSITEKCSEREKETKKSSKQARKTDNKTEDLKTFIAYLMNNKTLFDWMINEFYEHWKPLIDDGFITCELSEA